MKNALWESWELVRSEYRRGRINSERTLQAFLFRFLQDALPDHNVFCEPGVDVSDVRAIPDILVVEDGSVVAAVELKFKPQSYPVYEEDLRKLGYYGEHKETFPLTLDPATGRESLSRFRFADDCLLVFAAIGRFDADAVDDSFLKSKMPVGLADRFIALTHQVRPASAVPG